LLTDSTNLTFDGTTLTSAGFSGPLNGTVGATTANTGNFTTLTTSSTVTLNGGTANGVTYLNGSKVLTSGSVFTFDGSTTTFSGGVSVFSNNNFYMQFQRGSTVYGYLGTGSNTAGGAVTDLGIRAENNLVFAANGTEKMRLNTSGNLLLGLTSALLSTRLEVKSSNTQLAGFISSDANGTAYEVRGSAGKVSHYATYATSAIDCYHAWFTTTSAGAQSQAMTLDVSGNLSNTGNIDSGTGKNISLNADDSGQTTRLQWKYSGTAQAWVERVNANGAMAFGVQSSERMRIAGDGTVLIATTASLSRNLVIGGDTNTARVVPATDNVGYVGDISYRWQAIYAVNGTIQTSDAREKTQIQDSTLGLEFISSLRPVQYKWNDNYLDPRTHYGLIAQDVKAAIPEGVDFGGLIEQEDGGKMSLGYTEFVAPLVKAIQEQQALITQLQADVATLKGN